MLKRFSIECVAHAPLYFNRCKFCNCVCNFMPCTALHCTYKIDLDEPTQLMWQTTVQLIDDFYYVYTLHSSALCVDSVVSIFFFFLHCIQSINKSNRFNKCCAVFFFSQSDTDRSLWMLQLMFLCHIYTINN